MARAALTDPSPTRMTVQEFLAWDDGTDTRYELVGGEVFAMAPPSPAHSLIAMNLGREIGNRLKPPCRMFGEAGVRVPTRDDAFYQADMAISCTSLRPQDAHVPNPVVIIEVLSPSTNAHDRATKLSDYRAIPSVQEIALVSSTAIRAELWHRTKEGWEVTDLVGSDAALRLRSVDVGIGLAAVYEGVAFEPAAEGEAGAA